MKQNEVISSSDFIRHLTIGSGIFMRQGSVVEGDIRIDARTDHLNSLHLDGVNFTGMVTVTGFNASDGSLIFQDANFLGGLCIEGNEVRYLSIIRVKAPFLDVWRHKSPIAALQELEIDGSLDISGLDLSERLTFSSSIYSTLELMHPSTSGIIKVPVVKTDDPLAVFQFRMAGIPVFVSTDVAKKMMEQGAALQLAFT
jgi:hypothetical protein